MAWTTVPVWSADDLRFWPALYDSMTAVRFQPDVFPARIGYCCWTITSTTCNVSPDVGRSSRIWVATKVAPLGNLIKLPTGGITSACMISIGSAMFGAKNLICIEADFTARFVHDVTKPHVDGKR
ncbi:hypothetical protein SBA3_2940014 [Candidatus Sulfopaludibacter sp. SbA3]|nr:hypothetical protein SBA3_2940014 [Candidatus Sulfopaludibacter sp. SbA3]